jgi:N-acetylglucosaminyldiphosphoundecaprenol N-acetyl-beta-D-mannosaminyltransferase
MLTTLPHATPVVALPFRAPRQRVEILGIDFDSLTFAEAIEAIDRMIVDRRPGFLITANLNWAMLAGGDERLKQITRRAELVVADGMPVVWLSRLKKQSLPQRVTGADLVPALCELAAARGYRVFFLGAAEGVGQTAADQLKSRYPELQIAGVEAPVLAELSIAAESALLHRIRQSRADIVFAAFGQPKGELWLHDNLHHMGSVVAMQIGASIDFVAGRAQRAPRWIQRLGVEWLYRTWQEPRRMAGRYAANLWFLLKRLPHELGPKRTSASRAGTTVAIDSIYRFPTRAAEPQSAGEQIATKP